MLESSQTPSLCLCLCLRCASLRRSSLSVSTPLLLPNPTFVSTFASASPLRPTHTLSLSPQKGAEFSLFRSVQLRDTMSRHILSQRRFLARCHSRLRVPIAPTTFLSSLPEPRTVQPKTMTGKKASCSYASSHCYYDYDYGYNYDYEYDYDDYYY